MPIPVDWVVQLPFPSESSETSALASSSRFRRAVLDECYQSRFWARALEFYLLDNVTHGCEYRCLMASCPERYFKDPRDMLRHLKHCEFFSRGEFWCPTCDQVDSFKVVSKKKCSWDRVNLARKLLQKSLKVLHSISGYQSRAQQPLGDSLCVNCMNPISRNGSYGSSQNFQSRFPPTSTGSDFTFPPPPWELLATELPSELCQLSQLPDSVNTHRSSRHSLHTGLIPQPQAHQPSPSELSAVSSGQFVYPGTITSAFVAHTIDPSVINSIHPFSNDPIFATTMPPTRQGSRRGPALTVDTHPSASDWVPFNILLDEGETFDSSSGIDSQGIVPLTPKIITPQESENTPSVPNESLLSPDTININPSPSLSCSNFELSPISMSSAPEVQCDDCGFEPKGKSLMAYLRKHAKVHKNIKIPCPHCQKSFSRRDNLTYHLRRAHASVADEPAPKRRRGNSGSLSSQTL
ncbi:hypothetical protein F5Y14DRAFT_317021 [Nemania sp. NC0429]|nr:hypothetical protein F5Y14DRAFT_317021 [Nemania sp. NC0429]